MRQTTNDCVASSNKLLKSHMSWPLANPRTPLCEKSCWTGPRGKRRAFRPRPLPAESQKVSCAFASFSRVASHFSCTLPCPFATRKEAPLLPSFDNFGLMTSLKGRDTCEDPWVKSKDGDTANRSLLLSFLASTVHRTQHAPVLGQAKRSKPCAWSDSGV